MFRPGTTESECSIKFHNLRTQFNIENAKIKSSMKSGIGTDDVYKPNLWYFNNLKYLEAYCTPRKSRNSIEKNSTEQLLISNQNEELSKTKQLSQVNETFMDEEWLEDEYFDNSADKSIAESTTFLTKPSESVTTVNDQFSSISSHTASLIPDKTLLSRNISRPSPSISPANSIISSSVSTSSNSTHCQLPPVTTTKKRKSNTEDTIYAGAIEALADSLKQPIILKSMDVSSNSSNTVPDPVDACMVFIGSILKRFKNEIFKFEIMNTLVCTAIEASTKDVTEVRQT
ncbi:PREDICTED: uncharacterized protein LOC105556373 [Vollenhovia emeryi]|uniref:uncharacterized protein LOC105556373 n=1 Tax=Vollenhovia emeryi TaxID=411798 RepID=UPI0005F41F63|nr:PREDICTED: uncharacterized protein LOC105556373 [Vollenhovia emeryi]